MVEFYIADDQNSLESRINLLGKRFRESGSRALWNPTTRKTGERVLPVIEVIPSVLLGEFEEIAYARNRVEYLRECIDRYNEDNTYRTSYWLYWRHNKAASIVRDVIIDIHWDQNTAQSGHILDCAMLGNLVVKCRGRWERVIPVKRTFGRIGMGYLEGRVYLPNNSTVDSRIEKITYTLNKNNVPQLNPRKLTEVWMGIKEVKLGHETFDPLIQFGEGIPYNGMSTIGQATVTTGSRGYWRTNFSLQLIPPDLKDYIGRYTVLLVQKSTDLNTFYYLKHGNVHNSNGNVGNLNVNRRVYPKIINEFHIVNLGEVVVGDARQLNNQPQDFSMEVWAGRDSGSGQIELSPAATLILMPSKRFMYAEFDPVFTGEDMTFTYQTEPLLEHFTTLSSDTGERLSLIHI